MILNDFGTDDKSAWRTDEEFAREMLAGVNPVSIQRLKVKKINIKIPILLRTTFNSNSFLFKKIDELKTQKLKCKSSVDFHLFSSIFYRTNHIIFVFVDLKLTRFDILLAGVSSNKQA